jgi:hypothetical protein
MGCWASAQAQQATEFRIDDLKDIPEMGAEPDQGEENGARENKAQNALVQPAEVSEYGQTTAISIKPEHDDIKGLSQTICEFR